MVGLLPLRYQLPPAMPDPDDPDPDDWLVIECRVDDPRGGWAFVEPCLTVAETEELATWLTTVAQGGATPSSNPPTGEVVPDLRFCEPNLSFSLASSSAESVVVRVHFSYESRPPWAAGHSASLENWVEIDMTRTQLLASTATWRAEIAHFPQRT